MEKLKELYEAGKITLEDIKDFVNSLGDHYEMIDLWEEED